MARLGFFGGVRVFFSGFAFIVKNPSVWPWAVVPMALALVASALLSILGFWGAHRIVDALFGGADGAFAEVGLWTARILLYGLVIAAALLLGAACAQPLSGPALDRIVRAEESSFGRPSTGDAPFFESVGRALRVTLVTLFVGLVGVGLLTALEFMVPPSVVVTWPLKLALSALLATWNMLDYPCALRRMGVRARYAYFRANLPACFGLGTLLALLGLIPFIGLLVLPVGVAAATRLMLETESKLRVGVADGRS